MRPSALGWKEELAGFIRALINQPVLMAPGRSSACAVDLASPALGTHTKRSVNTPANVKWRKERKKPKNLRSAVPANSTLPLERSGFAWRAAGSLDLLDNFFMSYRSRSARSCPAPAARSPREGGIGPGKPPGAAGAAPSPGLEPERGRGSSARPPAPRIFRIPPRHRQPALG